MNQEQNNFNMQGNNGIPNNQPLNNINQNSSDTFNQNVQTPINNNLQQPILQQTNQINFDPNTGQPINQMNPQQTTLNPQINTFENTSNKKPKKNKLLIILAIIGGIVVGFIALFLIIFLTTSANSDKLVCKSNEGNITIMYNDKGITGYTATGMNYDLDKQKEVAKEIGIDAYLTEFNNWFKTNTTGVCTIDGKEVSNSNNNEDTEEENNTINEETQVVGDTTYGYLTIPKDWIKFYDVDGNTSIQYSYAGVYIVSLNYLEDTTYSAKEYASNFMYNKQNDSSVDGVTGATVQIGKNKEYTAYQVYMYYPSDATYLITYWFEAEDGKTHYIALEGPGELNGKTMTDYLYIAESFSLNK